MSNIDREEEQVRNEMLFTLSERGRGTLAMVITSDEWKREAVYHFLKTRLKEYIFFDLDMTAHSYTSLYKALQELLPSTILQSDPVQYLISVTGLETGHLRAKDSHIGSSSLVAQLNFERELIFNQPYIILLWVSESFDRELQKNAPDLMHWMSKRFVFNTGGSNDLTKVEEPAMEYITMKSEGSLSKKRQRIRQLEETWEKLILYPGDQPRLIKDKINLLLLLGKEYGALGDLDKAEEALSNAITMDNRLGSEHAAELLLESGKIRLYKKEYEASLQLLQSAMGFVKDSAAILPGDIYFQMGDLYSAWGRRKETLQHYSHALKSYLDADDKYRAGEVYTKIAYVYSLQDDTLQAMENYRLALECYAGTQPPAKFIEVFEGVAVLMESQFRWQQAVDSYLEVLKWCKKLHDEDSYVSGRVYLRMGWVYEELKDLGEAKSAFEKAIELLPPENHALRDIAGNSLRRVQEKIKEHAKSGIRREE